MAPDPAQAQLEEERLLVERAQSGETSALRPLFEKYSAPLYAGVILPRLGDAAAAEDILRETLLTALVKIKTFRWQGHGLYGWLRQIAINKVIDVHRRTQRAGRALADFAEESPRVTDARDGADELIIAAQEQRENGARVAAVMAALPARYRQAITLRLVEEHSREECASRLDVTIGNFDVILFRAVRAFRTRFGERGGGGDGGGRS